MEWRIEKVKSLWKKYTSLFLLVTLLFTSLPIQVKAEESENPSNSEVSEEIEKRGMTDEGMEQYLSAFKHGMPPHGGLGIGMERLTMKMMNEDNVRETTLFPRDLSRLEP